MNRDLLASFLTQGKPFSLRDFSDYHHLELGDAALILKSLKEAGDLICLPKKFYLPLSNQGLNSEECLSAPWKIIPYVFPNSIVGGWSAANYWGLTKELFKATLIFQVLRCHRVKRIIGKFEFHVYKSYLPINLGVEPIWIEDKNTQILISNVHRTIIDMLLNPQWGGGIQHVIDCFKNYLEEGYDKEIFLNYISYIKKATFFKRLGYISEVLMGKGNPLSEYSKYKISSGYALIDSSLECKKLVTRWRLYVDPKISI